MEKRGGIILPFKSERLLYTDPTHNQLKGGRYEVHV
jgi:hypothetical protein